MICDNSFSSLGNKQTPLGENTPAVIDHLLVGLPDESLLLESSSTSTVTRDGVGKLRDNNATDCGHNFRCAGIMNRFTPPEPRHYFLVLDTYFQ